MEDTRNFMANKESEKLTELYRYWGDRRAASNEGIPLIRDFYADYHQLATEAEGVSYATVKDGPVPGIWAIPAGAAARDTVSSLPMWPRPQACGRWSSTTGWLRNTACRPSWRTAGRHSTGGGAGLCQDRPLRARTPQPALNPLPPGSTSAGIDFKKAGTNDGCRCTVTL